MSERYSRLFTSPENLYATGSPVLIVAGALLKDNQTGKVLVQLKLQNIGTKPIKAVTVSIQPLDVVGNSLGNEVVYQYLDLNANRNGEFGSKTPIALPDLSTRSYSAKVIEVIFADNTVWQTSDEPWEALIPPITLERFLNDHELVKQYRIKFGADCKYKPTEQKDLWHCTCGELNQKRDAVCHRCRKALTSQLSVDVTALKQDRDNRTAEEQKKAAEDRAAAEIQAKKNKKLAIISVAVVSAVIAFVAVLNMVIIPSGKYNDAVALAQQGNYTQAAKMFLEIEGFSDSDTQIKEIIVKSTEKESTLSEVLEIIPDHYFQSNNEASYECAVALLEYGDTENAYKYFSFCTGYLQTQQYLVYLDGVKAFNNKKWDEAIKNFDSIRDFHDASEQLGNAYYEKIISTSEISVEDVIATLSKISNKSSKVEKLLASCKSLQKYSSEYRYSSASSGDYSDYRVEFDFYYRWGVLYADPTLETEGSIVSLSCDPAEVESTYGDYQLYFKSLNGGNKALYCEFWVSETGVKLFTNLFTNKPTIYFKK